MNAIESGWKFDKLEDCCWSHFQWAFRECIGDKWGEGEWKHVPLSPCSEETPASSYKWYVEYYVEHTDNWKQHDVDGVIEDGAGNIGNNMRCVQDCPVSMDDVPLMILFHYISEQQFVSYFSGRISLPWAALEL